MGAAHSNYCHDDPVGGEVSGMDKLNLLLMDGINMERCSLCGICIPSVLWHAVEGFSPFSVPLVLCGTETERRPKQRPVGKLHLSKVVHR